MKKIFFILFLLTLFSLNTNYLIEDNEVFASSTKLDQIEKLDTDTSMEQLICNVLGFLTGGVGKALAAFACIGISLAFLGGKVSWTLILTFSLGMACIFGAPTIIKAFTGGDAACSNISGGSGGASN